MVKTKNDIKSHINTQISQEDREVWEKYINNVYSTPVVKFVINKGRDHTLKYKIDLHGMTVQKAFNTVRAYLEEHAIHGTKFVTVITGKSGKICDEFPYWCNNLGVVKECKPIPDGSGTAGAYIVTLEQKS